MDSNITEQKKFTNMIWFHIATNLKETITCPSLLQRPQFSEKIIKIIFPFPIIYTCKDKAESSYTSTKKNF